MYQYVLVEKKGRVGVLTLNRPKVMNAINLGLIKEISARLEELDADGEVRVKLVGQADPMGFDQEEEVLGIASQ